MNNCICLGDYVQFHDSDIGKVIGVEVHPEGKFYAQLRVAFIDKESNEVCQIKVRADVVKRIQPPQELIARLEGFIPVYGNVTRNNYGATKV